MHFQASWVPEFAREYLSFLDEPYTYDDILQIAHGQYQLETACVKASSGLVFCDTDFLVTKIWCEFKYGKCHPWILNMLDNHRYDHYLLCNIDLPWEDDPLREHPHLRKELFDHYLYDLTSRGFPFTVIAGFGDERLKSAIRIIENLLVKHEQ